MSYEKALIAGKLRRWEKFLDDYRLPKWEDIPDFGLYMEQVIVLLKDYLDYLPPELKEGPFITPATINNYVRTKVMPEPVKKRYYRTHIAYLIIIVSLKYNLSISYIQKLLPVDLTEEELEGFYRSYAAYHEKAASRFIEEIRATAGPILDHDDTNEHSVSRTEDLITLSAVIGGFCRIFAEKLLNLKDKTLEDGGSIEVRTSAERKAEEAARGNAKENKAKKK